MGLLLVFNYLRPREYINIRMKTNYTPPVILSALTTSSTGKFTIEAVGITTKVMDET